MAPARKAPVAYLAGPEVFSPNARDIGEAKISICRERGIDAQFLLIEINDEHSLTPADRGHAIFAACVEMMDECDLVIANMTPFRGVSMDVGTAIEMGYMYGRGRPVLGYTNVEADYDARVGRDTLQVESFGFADNLMCEGLCGSQGGPSSGMGPGRATSTRTLAASSSASSRLRRSWVWRGPRTIGASHLEHGYQRRGSLRRTGSDCLPRIRVDAVASQPMPRSQCARSASARSEQAAAQ